MMRRENTGTAFATWRTKSPGRWARQDITMPYWFDGNNIIGQSTTATQQDPMRRRSFLAWLSGHATSRGGWFLVFFDGDNSEHFVPPRGVRVRYSAPLSTDDAILSQAEGAPAPAEITVVTNDRGLSARCRSAGLKTMNWGQFTDRMAASSHARGDPDAKPDNIDLQEWSRYFGIDPEGLK